MKQINKYWNSMKLDPLKNNRIMMLHQKVALIQVAYVSVTCPNTPDNPSFSRMTVEQNCPDKTAGPCNWRSPNDHMITTPSEAQELAAIHFPVCITNPEVIQRRMECLAEADHNR